MNASLRVRRIRQLPSLQKFWISRLSPICTPTAFAAAWLVLAAAIVLAGFPAHTSTPPPKTLEFRGRVVLPVRAVLRGKRITLSLLHVGTAFSAQTRADSNGRFRFKKIPPGTYSLSIFVPGAGEIRSTLDITPAFADAEGRVEKEFSYDEEALAQQALPPQQGVVSVRELTIPRRARSEYAAARRDLRNHRVDSAWRRLQKAVEIAPQFVEALNYLGVLAYQQRDFTAAEEYFRQALEQEPDAYEPLVNLGGALLSLDRIGEAVEVNTRAQAAQPKDPLASAQLGLSYYMQGNDEEALNYLLLTEQLDPAHFTNPQIPLANIYLRNADKQSAIEELEDFLNRHPDSPVADSVRAMIQRIGDENDPETAATTAFQ
ncbi:MAG: tetratricopeptide repeat protein [Acidobacteria bacterium]|nr:tetratricopeptide repeat protein [Acidobacteriota bacterium]